MNNILIICSEYGEIYDANGICIKNVVNELIRRKNNVYIIAQGRDNVKIAKEINGAKVYYIKFKNITNIVEKKRNYFFSILVKIFLLVRRICVFILYPNVSFIRYRKVLKLAKKIINENDISIIIGAYRPFESLATLIKLKKIYKDKIKSIAYHLDLLLEPNTTNCCIKKYKIYRGKGFINKELKVIDSILLPESAQGRIKSDKIEYFDFPLFIENKKYIEFNYCFKKNCFNIVYIGSIDGKNRKIDYIKNLIQNVSMIDNKKIVLHIWGNINECVKEKIKNNERIIYHGLINNKYTISLLNKADCLLNLSNIITYNMIPSKIFQLFSVGKPIINIVYNKDDAALSYFERSGISLNLFANDNCENANKKFIEFIYNSDKLLLNKNEFIKSLPSYTASLILKSKEK